MRHLKGFENLKTFEHIKSSYEVFTRQEMFKIHQVVNSLIYILEDEQYRTRIVTGGGYRYRILVYLVSPDEESNKQLKDSKKFISQSDPFNEFVDRIRSELGDEYIVYVDDGGLLFVVIEKAETK